MSRTTFRNVITSEDTLKNINEKNKQLTKQFLRHKSTSASETTIRSYGSDLNIFFSWLYLYRDNIFFIDIKKFDLVDFFAFANEDLQWKHSRKNRMRSTLSSLSIFVERFLDDKYGDFKNIILRTIDSFVGSPAREKTILSDEQVDGLLEHLSQKDSQQACWLALAVASGARQSELLRFEMELIDDGADVFEGIFIETSKRMKTKGRSGGKMIKKYVLKDLFLPHYEKWKKDRAEILERLEIEDHGAMFIRKDGSPATDGTIRSWVRGMGKHLGVDLYPHSLRHRTTTALAEKSIPSELIQFLMGWVSPSMVMLYTDLDAKDRKWDELDNLK